MSRNAYLEVRATKPDGTVNDWFNISKCDTESAVKQHLIPNRRYLTSFQLVRHYEIQRDNLPAEARKASQQDYSGAGWVDQLKADLHQAGAPEKNVAIFMKNDRSMMNFASSIARARWGEVKNVQIRIRSVHTRPFADRNTDNPLKTEIWQAGHVPASPADAGIDDNIAELDAPKAGC